MEKIKVLLVDTNVIFRQGLRVALAADESIEITGDVEDHQQCLNLVKNATIDVVLADSRLASQNDSNLTREIRKFAPHVGVILLAATEDDEQLFEAIRGGAAAYYTKDVNPTELILGIKRVARGEYQINDTLLIKPAVAARVLRQFQELTLAGKEMEEFLTPLSGREIEILDLVAKGNSNKEIARALSISDQTVKNHVTSILRKLAANDRTHAVVLALQRGLIKIS